MASLLVAVFFMAALASSSTVEATAVPAIYVFGDSTADVGNNNFLPGTGAKANFRHNGIDFPSGVPTGRFSNGFNGIDILAQMMGFRMSPPAALSIQNPNVVLRGVSFASGGSGIFDVTGQNVSLSMNEQVVEFTKVANIITRTIGPENARRLLAKSLFVFSTANNDIFGFFRTFGPTNTTQKEQFISQLAANFKDQLQRLHYLGARKFAVIGTSTLGCVPSARILTPNGQCVEELNELSRRHNEAVTSLLRDLAGSLEGMRYSFSNAYKVLSSVVEKPVLYGYKEVQSACCGAGRFNAAAGCTPNATFCGDRNQFLFWDGVHPSQTTYGLVAAHAFKGGPELNTPVNIAQLINW